MISLVSRKTLLSHTPWLLLLLSWICTPARSTAQHRGVRPGAETGPRPAHALGAGPSDSMSIREAPRVSDMTGQHVGYRVCYLAPQAKKVYILWGLNQWQVPDRHLWPPGAMPAKGYPHCEMQPSQNAFRIDLTIPRGSMLDYCFHVVRKDGSEMWDTFGAPNRDYHSWAIRGGTAVVIATDGVYIEKTVVRRQLAWQPATWRTALAIVLPSIAVLAHLFLKRRNPV